MSRIAVIIASRGRPEDLRLWLDHAARQTLRPALMIWSVHSKEDVPQGDLGKPAVEPRICWSKLGTCAQRNTGIEHVPADIDIVAFFDDDYVPTTNCLEGIARAFEHHPDAIGFTGHVIADGITTAGISVDEANRLVTEDEKGR